MLGILTCGDMSNHLNLEGNFEVLYFFILNVSLLLVGVEIAGTSWDNKCLVVNVKLSAEEQPQRTQYQLLVTMF